MPHEHSIPDESLKKLSQILIMDYDITKSGVDILDKLFQEYTCRRSTRRWQLSLFLNFMNIGAYNAFVIWKLNTQKYIDFMSMKNARKQFLEERGEITSDMDNNPTCYTISTIQTIKLSGRELRKVKYHIDSEEERLTAKRGRWCHLLI